MVQRLQYMRISSLCIGIQDGTGVIVTFLESSPTDLRARGIDGAHAADLRARLATFAEDWDSPEMDIYDEYHAAQALYKRGDVALVLFPHSSLPTAKWSRSWWKR